MGFGESSIAHSSHSMQEPRDELTSSQNQTLLQVAASVEHVWTHSTCNCRQRWPKGHSRLYHKCLKACCQSSQSESMYLYVRAGDGQTAHKHKTGYTYINIYTYQSIQSKFVCITLTITCCKPNGVKASPTHEPLAAKKKNFMLRPV